MSANDIPDELNDALSDFHKKLMAWVRDGRDLETLVGFTEPLLAWTKVTAWLAGAAGNPVGETLTREITQLVERARKLNS